MLHANFITHLEKICSQIEVKNVKLRAYEKIYGGDINQSFRLAMSDEDYFIKINTADKLEMFEKEARGLKMLSDSKSFVVPQVYQTGIFENQSFLLMQYVESLETGSNPEQFARSLARLHQNTQDCYGLESDNYIGELPQTNTCSNDWVSFYVEQRLKPQIDLKPELIPLDIRHSFEKFFIKLPDLLPFEKPALLHGDLWNGNYFYTIQGKAVLFDPAVYYGHREVDIAMMNLFGGFETDIYYMYNEIHPMESGWKERLKIYQLYPLLVHANLFGTSYLSSINQILKMYL